MFGRCTDDSVHVGVGLENDFRSKYSFQTNSLVVLVTLLTLSDMFYLEYNNLGKFYGKTEVFRNLNFRAEGPACIGIGGANGSGKSTLLKCLSGLLRPTEGRITWQQNGSKLDIRSVRLHTGYAAPYIQLYKELSVLENLSFVARLRGHSEAPHVTQLLELCELDGKSGQEFGSLSSGQQQRVRLAAALVSDPPILMLDEPGTNLDTAGYSLVSRLVDLQRTKGGMTFLASNREEELALCDESIMLSPASVKA
jgi:ABC-type multidrug transport system ATPase subunit